MSAINKWKVSMRLFYFTFSASKFNARIADKSLDYIMSKFESRQADVSSTAIVYLICHFGVVVLKHNKNELFKERSSINAIAYPSPVIQGG